MFGFGHGKSNATLYFFFLSVFVFPSDLVFRTIGALNWETDGNLMPCDM